MDHEHGKDPTPQGRVPDPKPRSGGQPAITTEEQKYENSAPGPAAQEDGAFFLGYKKEQNHSSDQ